METKIYFSYFVRFDEFYINLMFYKTFFFFFNFRNKAILQKKQG